MIASLFGLIKLKAVDPALPLIGTSYALQRLNNDSKKDSDVLKACLALLCKITGVFQGDFQALAHLRTPLQQISLYLMENLAAKVLDSKFKNWNDVERVAKRVLEGCFFKLMEHQKTELATSEILMRLLDDFLPSKTQHRGWDIPLIACLADALSLTGQLGRIISALVKQSVLFEQESLEPSSKKALQMLEETYRRCLQILRRRDSKGSQFFVALVLARELMAHSLRLVLKAMTNDTAEERFAIIMDHILDLMQLPLVERPQEFARVELCDEEGQSRYVEHFPAAFTSLFVVAANRRHTNPLSPNEAVAKLYAAVAMKSHGSDLHRLLQHCKAETMALSNALNLSVLLPGQWSAETQEVLSHLHDIADEQLSAQAREKIAKLCHARHNHFQKLLHVMRCVGEIFMQCSADDDDIANKACKVTKDLPDSLGPAARLMASLAVEEDEDDEEIRKINDFMRFCGKKSWRDSILAHLLCFLGATHKSVNTMDVPPGVRPFAAFNNLEQSVLDSTFWPGVPDDWWQALRYSGLKQLPIDDNIVWAECRCGYRYCFGDCGAPMDSQPCVGLGREGNCLLSNGGRNHQFADGQELIAVVVTRPPHGREAIYDPMRQYDTAFKPPGPCAGLFSLTEADEQASVGHDRSKVSHSLMSETVRQDWNQPLGKPPNRDSGLHPVTFRVLHLLVHASPLLNIQMEFVQGRANTVHLLQTHLHEVARMKCVRTVQDTVEYFMANVDADLVALGELLTGNGSNLEIPTLFVHAVLHKLGSLEPWRQPSQQSLTSHEARVAYEKWFHETIVQDILGRPDAQGNFALPGVHRLHAQASQATDPHVVPTADFLARRGLPTKAWLCMGDEVRQSQLFHILRPLVFTTTEATFETIRNSGNGFVILRLLMAGLAQNGRWQIQDDLLRAASLAWILPFMRMIRNKEGGKMTMKEARRTTIQQWIERQPQKERHEAWILFRNCEAAWNRALAAHPERVGCHVVTQPTLSAKDYIAMMCPVVEAAKFGRSDLAPENIAAVGLHALAVSHNKLIAKVQTYLNSAGAHVKARLHPTASSCESGGQCMPSGEDCNDGKVRLIQHASEQDLLLFPSQLEDTTHLAKQEERYGPRIFNLDYKVESFLQDFFQMPWGADLKARGTHDFEAMENHLAWRLIAGRRPLQVSCEDWVVQFHMNSLHGHDATVNPFSTQRIGTIWGLSPVHPHDSVQICHYQANARYKAQATTHMNPLISGLLDVLVACHLRIIGTLG